MPNKLGSLVILIIGGLFSISDSHSSEGKPRVLSTISYLHDLVQIIGGDLVEAESLMGPGVDPHLYKASARDLGRIKNTDLVFALGLQLEGRINEVLLQLKERGHPLVFVGDTLPKEKLFDADPHVWFDPELWILASRTVRDTLVERLPLKKETLFSRQLRWETDLGKIKIELQKGLNQIPKEKRILVTSHDAFRYWGRAFDVTVKAIQGISTDSEASLKHIQELADELKQKNVPAIFVETSVSPASIERLQSLTGIKIGGELYGDALGSPGSSGDTYIKALQYNTSIFLKAFQ